MSGTDRTVTVPDKASVRNMRSTGVEELAHGQLVIVSARWILILAGLLLTLWNADPINELRVQIMLILLMAVGNFYLHAQALIRRPVLSQVIYAASAADLVIVSIFVSLGGGFESNSYTFFFPAILGFSVVFPTWLTFAYTAGAAWLYAAISMGTLDVFGGEVATQDLQVLIVRLLILAAIAVCGNVYWRVEHGRRQAAEQAREEYRAEVAERVAAADS